MQKNKSRNARLVAMDEEIVETVSVNVSLVTMDGIVRKVSNHNEFFTPKFCYASFTLISSLCCCKIERSQSKAKMSFYFSDMVILLTN